jgi:hypothetical protein
MPSAYVMRIFSNLVGGTCLAERPRPPDRLAVVKGSERRFLVVNDAPTPKSMLWDRNVIGAETRLFESSTLVANARKGEEPLRADKVELLSSCGEVAKEGLRLVLPGYSVTCCRCFR